MSGSTAQSSDLASLEQFLANFDPSILQGGAPQKDPKELIAFRESKEGRELVAWIKSKYERAKGLRFKEEKQWNLNLAFYNGNQWVELIPFNDASNPGGLAVPRSVTAQRGRERQTINRIKSIIRTEMSKFISQRPGASVVPSTDEDEDILAAQAGKRVWESTSERRELSEEWIDAVFWTCITGNGFIKTTWDPTVVDKDSDVSGDVTYGSVDPFKIFVPDLKIKNLQDQPFVIHAYAKSKEYLEQHYADVLQGQSLTGSCYESDEISEANYSRPRGTAEKAYDACMLYEIWVRPGQSKLLPNGGMAVMIDDILVEAYTDGMPYDHGMFPFAHLHHIKTERFYRASIIEDLIDLQRDYNKLRSQIAESRKKMGKPQILAPKGSVVASKMTNEIAAVIEYRLGAGGAPTAMPLQNLPTYILQELDYILRDMEDLSGQHEVSKGQTPPGVTAATAISYLQEADDSYILQSFKAMEYAYGQIAKQTLGLSVQFWDLPRRVKVTGKDEVFSTEMLSGADLKRGTDIRIEPGSSLPTSKAAKQALIMDLMMNFPQDVPANKGLELMEIGATDKLIDDLKADQRQAKRENIRFKRLNALELQQYADEWDRQIAMMGDDNIDPQTGQPMQAPLAIPVNSFDNHDVHIEEHNRFRKSQEFEVLPDEVKELIEAHVEQHKAMKQQDMLQQFMSQIPTDGSTPGVSGTMNGTEVDLESSGDAQAEGLPPEEPNAAPGASESAELPTEGGAF